MKPINQQQKCILIALHAHTHTLLHEICMYKIYVKYYIINIYLYIINNLSISERNIVCVNFDYFEKLALSQNSQPANQSTKLNQQPTNVSINLPTNLPMYLLAIYLLLLPMLFMCICCISMILNEK